MWGGGHAVGKKGNVKVEVYGQVSRAKRHSPNYTQQPPGHRTSSFLSYLNSPGSIQPSCHFQQMELFKHTNLLCPTRYPLTPGSRECTCEQSALPRSTMSQHNSAQPAIKPVISRLQVMHATTQPQCPTKEKMCYSAMERLSETTAQ